MRTTFATSALFAACAASPQPTSVELPQQLPTPVATVSIALPQKHDPPPPHLHSAHAWTPPTLKQPPDATQARYAFMRGVQAYAAANYTQALVEFETAWSFSPHDAVLYNIATSLETVGRIDEAIDVYGRFADTHPPNEGDVRILIDSLRKRP